MSSVAQPLSSRSETYQRQVWTATRLRELVTTIILTPIALIWMYPFLWMVSASLKTNDDIFRSGLNLIPSEFMWENFERAWVQANISQYFFNTVVVAAGSVLVVIITTGAMGYVLGRYSFPGKRIVVGIFVATVFLPKGYTIIPVFELISNLNLDGTLLGVILAQSGGAHVIFILLFTGYFNQLPKELEEAGHCRWCRLPAHLFPDHATACQASGGNGRDYAIYRQLERFLATAGPDTGAA